MKLRKKDKLNKFHSLIRIVVTLTLLLLPHNHFIPANNEAGFFPDVRLEDKKLIVPLPRAVIEKYLSNQPRQWIVNNDKQQLEFISSRLERLNPDHNSFSFRIELINNLFTRIFKKRVRLSRKKCIVRLESFFNLKGSPPLKSLKTSSIQCDKGITGLDLLSHSSEVLEEQWMKLFKVNLQHSYLEKYAISLLNKKIAQLNLPQKLDLATAERLPEYLVVSGVHVKAKTVEVALKFDETKFKNLP